MCQGTDRLRVKTERIPNRLSEGHGLPLNEALYVLHESLVGFKTINQYNGPVSITDEMIGFNQDGKVRVWLNTNFSTNLSEADSQIFESRRQKPAGIGEAAMIDQLFSVVEQHVQGGRYSEQFRAQYSTSPPSTFDEALAFVKRFTSQSGIQVPGRISVTSSHSSVPVGASISAVSQPAPGLVATTTSVSTEQVASQSSGLFATTGPVVSGLPSLPHYNSGVQVQQLQTSFAPQRSVVVLPQSQSKIPTVGRSTHNIVTTGSQSFIPAQAIVQAPSPVAIQRPVIQQSVSVPPPTQITPRTVIATQESTIASKIPVQLPAVQPKIVAPSRQTVVQTSQVLPQQRISLPNVRPLSPVQAVVVPPSPSFVPGNRLFQHLNEATKTVTTINQELIQKPTTAVFQPVVEVKQEPKVELIQGGTFAGSKLHTHVHEGKTIVHAPRTSNLLETQVIPQTTFTTVQAPTTFVTEVRQPERVVTQQVTQPIPLRSFVTTAQQPTATTNQTIAFKGLPHHHGSQVVAVRQPV